MKARHEFETDEAYNSYLRDYYAGQAMQGLCVNGAYSREIQKQCEKVGSNSSTGIATYATMIADALIKALNDNP